MKLKTLAIAKESKEKSAFSSAKKDSIKLKEDDFHYFRLIAERNGLQHIAENQVPGNSNSEYYLVFKIPRGAFNSLIRIILTLTVKLKFK